MRNHILKLIYVICSICICIMLSVLGYAFPVTDILDGHVKESGRRLIEEGQYPAILDMYNSQLDNYTDALIINTATYDGGEPLMQRVFSNYSYSVEGKNYVESLYYSHLSDTVTSRRSYSRYWHGYVPFVKLLLVITNLQGIRHFNSILHILLFSAIVILLAKKNYKYGMAYTVCWIFLGPFSLQMSIQFSSVYYIYSVASCLLLTNFEYIERHIGFSIFFMIIGIITSWIDMLTYPIATLGIPLTILFILEKTENFSKTFCRCIMYSIAWGSGYAIMWALKWILSSLILGQDIIADALHTIIFRVSNGSGGITWSKWEVIRCNLSHFCHKIYYVLIIFSVALILFKGKNYIRIKELLYILQFCVPFLCIIAMPFIWYFVLSNHSMIHNWFTFRSLAVSIFALLSMLVKCKEIKIPLKNRTGENFHE